MCFYDNFIFLFHNLILQFLGIIFYLTHHTVPVCPDMMTPGLSSQACRLGPPYKSWEVR
jgi:hypothetical protein